MAKEINMGEQRNYSVNSVNFKLKFEDGHSCYASKGKSLSAQERHEQEITGLVAEHGNIESKTVISYLVWDKAAAEGTPSIRVKANAFGRPVDAGHSFLAEMGDEGVLNKGVFVPSSFKVYRKEQKTVSYASVQGLEKAPDMTA